MSKQYMTAKDIAEVIGMSESYAHKVIRELNAQLKEMGYLTVPGKVSRAYFNEKWYGAEVANG